MRNFFAALGWMTTLPVGKLQQEHGKVIAMDKLLSWLPATGAMVGGVIMVAAYTGASINPWLGAWFAMLAWFAVTGGLHADGLADLADAMGAGHSDKEHFVAVLKDPHVGSFGVLALVLLVASKLVLLVLFIQQGLWWSLFLIPIWARLGILFWSKLPALTDGFAASLQSIEVRYQALMWSIGLTIASLLIGDGLWLAWVAIFLWYVFLKHKIKGMNGDCLGAGVEVCEVLLLLLVVI